MKKIKVLSAFIILVIAFAFHANNAFAATGITVNTPQSVKAVSAGYDRAKITWGTVSGADGYSLYRATSSTGTFSSIKDVTTTYYTNTGLTTGKNYYYKVKAFKHSGTTKVYSKYSTVVSVMPIPATPANSKAVSGGYNSLKLTWNAVTGASGYQVYRATSSTGSYSYIKTTTYISYTNTSLTAGNTYYYKIRAYKTVGGTKVYGKFSTMTSAKPIPATPTNLKSALVNNTSAKISWDAVNGASGYKVYRAKSSTGTYSSIKTTTSTTYTDTELTGGSTYYYKVIAYKTVGTTRVYGKFTTSVKVVTIAFDASIASKNISGEFTDTGSGVIAILTNNNSYAISLSATIIYYDAAGSMLAKTTESNYYFEPGKKCSMYFIGPYDNNYEDVAYSSYKVSYSVESTEYQTSNLADIKVSSNIGMDNVMVEVTNSGNKSAEFTEIGIVFYKDGKAIAHDYQYAECGVPGSTDYLEFSFPYDENWDTIQIDSYQVFVNSSYDYTW